VLIQPQGQRQPLVRRHGPVVMALLGLGFGFVAGFENGLH